MEWNNGMENGNKCTQLRLICVTDAVQSRLNHLVYLQNCCFTAEALLPGNEQATWYAWV